MDNTVDIPHEVVPIKGEPNVVVLNFADAKIPVFKESRNKDWILYGEDNQYPEYLTYLFNKSAKHNAIITGKAYYIFGEGYENGDLKVNRLGDTLNDIAEKCILDAELYGGWRVEVIWNAGRRISELYHIDYNTIRAAKEGGWFYKENWHKNNREDPQFMEDFNPLSPVGSQVYAFNQYRPGARFYPLPAYIGANNYIETDIEISIYYLSAIRNGMMPSKMIQFFKGEPSEEKKREVENRMAKKFSGAGNAGKFLLVFNESNATKSVEVNDLSSNDLDKQFQELNKTCQQEIYAGHNVTSPILFGIKTEGQLGGATELKTAYEIFQNTYSKPRAKSFDKELNQLLSFSVFAGEYILRPTDPIGWQIPDELLKQAITPDEARIKLGLPVIEKAEDSPAAKTLNAIAGVSPLVATKILDNLTKNEIRALASLPPMPDGDFIPNPDGSAPEPVATPTLDSDLPQVSANDNIKNLTAKQHQQLMRIIRQYSKGQLTEIAARALLRTGLGLDDNDINSLLGIQIAMSKEEDVIAMFDQYGDSQKDFFVLKKKSIRFSVDETPIDEDVYIKEAFKTYDVTITEDQILRLLRKDPRTTPKVIGEAIGETEAYVNSKIDSLVKRGYIETKTIASGVDEIIERVAIEEKELLLPPEIVKNPPAQVFIKYSYEVKPGIGPAIIPTTRPFCRRMVQLNRFYSRQEIENLSQRLGYSVWDRKGGWWGHKEECRHRWVSNIVVKKK